MLAHNFRDDGWKHLLRAPTSGVPSGQGCDVTPSGPIKLVGGRGDTEAKSLREGLHISNPSTNPLTHPVSPLPTAYGPHSLTNLDFSSLLHTMPLSFQRWRPVACPSQGSQVLALPSQGGQTPAVQQLPAASSSGYLPKLPAPMRIGAHGKPCSFRLHLLQCQIIQTVATLVWGLCVIVWVGKGQEVIGPLADPILLGLIHFPACNPSFGTQLSQSFMNPQNRMIFTQATTKGGHEGTGPRVYMKYLFPSIAL